ncbi:MAG: class I SAM-dependent methyltransferase [Nitrospirae bacterium]|nr:class I SAM-dependent methyltransferase [Nitrospirota bacterium]
MGRLLNIITPLHKQTARDYLARMSDGKVDCMKVARRFDRDFWDGDRRYGYGGYRYDGRWSQPAAELIKTYNLGQNAKILDVGCGKGFLLYELKKLLPECTVVGFDLSPYAVENSKQEIKPHLMVGNAREPYPYGDKSFDLVISITTLHNLRVYELKSALKEIERVGRNKYIAVESYNCEQQLFNLQCWALTCESFYKTEEWVWIYNEFGYTGDYEFIYFD